MFVACIRAGSSSVSAPARSGARCSVTQAASSTTWIRMSSHATVQRLALAKMFSQERRTSSQPFNRCHPGGRNVADSSCSQTCSIAERFLASSAR